VFCDAFGVVVCSLDNSSSLKNTTYVYDDGGLYSCSSSRLYRFFSIHSGVWSGSRTVESGFIAIRRC